MEFKVERDGAHLPAIVDGRFLEPHMAHWKNSLRFNKHIMQQSNQADVLLCLCD